MVVPRNKCDRPAVQSYQVTMFELTTATLSEAVLSGHEQTKEKRRNCKTCFVVYAENQSEEKRFSLLFHVRRESQMFFGETRKSKDNLRYFAKRLRNDEIMTNKLYMHEA